MGVSSEREKLEAKILELKYKRVEIQEEKEEMMEKLKKLTGKEVIRKPIPDYIDETSDIKKDVNTNKVQSRSNTIKTKKTMLNKSKTKNNNGSINSYENKLKKNNSKKAKN